MAVLDARNIVKIYGDSSGEAATTALDGVSFSMNKGEFVAIMGPSGSGKTTLLNVMSGIDSPTSGEVTIEGQKISKMTGNKLALFRRKQLGFVFQEFNLLNSLNVQENMMLPMILEKKKAAEMEDKVQDLASLFGIESILNKYPYHTSGGQQQRTAVSRALVNEPSIIFADEPTGNLDSKSSTVIMECFEKIVHELSTTVLIVTHDVFAASYCEKVVFIKDGLIDSYIVKKGSRKEFLNQIMDNLAVLGGRPHDL
ncbi:multidrug ABC transporter ATP-binding protein [Virgibacillus profundi]|uniref:Multidrug ABC transporter ATP-binding protein n=1 Tax=Virgibacillus profundi TaxID=2024555 RepID=A0A2A2IAY4_9BACI|nr:ABC transporter ATP-binding protein [Virgibacillus profundi]PAV28223.1 multidrug ABC transporter ATP-binding protein [Virgibacillus profundi]PXY52528.1 ABC transporter ATP-binding protein [Virgibacillus profundi]